LEEQGEMMRIFGFAAIVIAVFINPLPSESNDIPVPKSADISVGGIFLFDSESVKTVLGEDIDLIMPIDDFAQIKLVNGNNTELLVLIFHPGSILGNFAEAIVRRSVENKDDQIIQMPSSSHFVTGKNIRLGIPSEELISILGKPERSVEENGRIKAYYEIAGCDQSEFLKHYNMPQYRGEYNFVDDSLVEFKFGFPYP
jgi:hypothetical protein